MGKYIRPLSDAVFTIASDDLWIESLAIQQLHTTANLPNMQRVVGMPDLHPGRGYPIGAAFFSVGRFYPALVGNDIGCGGNDSNLLIVFYVQIMPDDFVMQLHRF